MQLKNRSQSAIQADIIGFADKPSKAGNVLHDLGWTKLSGDAYDAGLQQYLKQHASAGRLTNIDIHDGRELMSASGLTPAEFFEKFGFVLLTHSTSMQPPDWHNPDKIENCYLPESFELISKNLGSEAILSAAENIKTRGPNLPGSDSPSVGYGLGVHQDFAATSALYRKNLVAYGNTGAVDEFDIMRQRSDVYRHTVACLWRPIKPMEKPVRQTPLALCDPTSVHPDDIVPVKMTGLTDSGLPSYQLQLAWRPSQRWYYFPDLTTNEAILFRQFDQFTDGSGRPHSSVFHCAFTHASAEADAEPRYSADIRINIWYTAP